jgi:hypothetical protein
MRTVLLLCAAIPFFGCAEPPAPPETEEPITVAIQEPPFRPCMTEEERERYFNCTDPLLRALARREIDVGMRIEPVLARFPNFEVLRHEPYITVRFGGNFAGQSLVAKNGKLIAAIDSSCEHCDVFFDVRTKTEYALFSKSYSAALEERNGFVAPPPRAKP